jgi:3-hydroxybutyryl-CoA dehydrogenase
MRIETIAIIGATELGCKFAALALRAGCRTILEDISISALERAAVALNGRRSAKSGEAGRVGVTTPAIALPVRAVATSAQEGAATRLILAHSVEDAIRDADLIIEAVADELEMKLELFTIFDRFAKPGAIFASTTAALAIDDLAEMTVCPERCIAMRIVPSGLAEELQLRRGRATSLETLEFCREVIRRMGLASIVVPAA